MTSRSCTYFRSVSSISRRMLLRSRSFAERVVATDDMESDGRRESVDSVGAIDGGGEDVSSENTLEGRRSTNTETTRTT
jgi:hypothetical protein